MSSAHRKVAGSLGKGIASCDGEGISCEDCGVCLADGGVSIIVGDTALVREDALAFLVGGVGVALLAFRLSERLLLSGSSQRD